MTLGQHIQELRRAVGLTQEGLGEALGVSRQAVSKWESDIALPEVDTLITMSRIFGVTVGELLQVEPPSEEASGELTDRELAAVEAIVRRYVEEMESRRPAPKKRRRWPFVLLILCILLAANWVVLRMENLASNLNNLQFQLNNMNSTVSSQINGITNQVTDILESQNSLTVDYGSEVTAIDISADTVTVEVWATPKTWQPGMRVEFFADCGGQIVTLEGTEGDGHRFAATLTLPLVSSITVDARFIADGITQTQRVEEWYSLRSSTYPSVSVDNHRFIWFFSEDLPADGRVTFEESDLITHFSLDRNEFPNLVDERPVVVQAKAGLFHNRTLVQWLTLPDGATSFVPDANTDRTLYGSEVTLSLVNGDEVTVAALLTDNYGRSWMVTGFTIVVENGAIDNSGFIYQEEELDGWVYN